MKKIYSSILLCCLLMLTACEKYLDIKPVGSVIPATLVEYRALLASTYNTVKSLRDRGMSCLRSDEMVAAAETDWNQYHNFHDIEIWNDIDPNPNTYSFGWLDYYNVIFTANEIIAAKNDIKDGTTEEINQLVGEAYMLRAYMHFILVNLYGQPYTKEGALETLSVPLKLNNDLEASLFRSKVADVYASIESDVANSRQFMNIEQWEPNFVYRFSTVAIEAFQSRLALYEGKWQESYDASKKVLAKKDALLDFNVAPTEDEATAFPNHFRSVENIVPLEKPVSDGFRSDIMATQQLLDMYVEGDLRKDRYFNDERISEKTGGDFLCSFRTGEIYLNIAEAAARLNKMDEARQYLLKLMKNRFTPEAFASKEAAVNAMAQEALIQEILNERYRELAFEGHRWFDLRRTTRPSLTKVFDGKTYTLGADDVHYTLKIPEEVKDVNPQLRD